MRFTHAGLRCFLFLPLFLAACVQQPLYDWRSKSAASTYKEKVSMSEALQHLWKARDGYQAAINEQLNAENGVSRSLIVGSGALLTAAGLKAHTDVLLVGGALGGTIYGLGNSELPRARINAYLAGIDALNCAESSVAAIRVTDLNSLKKILSELSIKIGELEEATGSLRTEYAATGGKAEGGANALISAESTLKSARIVESHTGAFLARNETAAYELYTQVERIDRTVISNVVTATATLAQAKLIAGGIGADISAIVAKAVSDASATRTASAAAAPVAQGASSGIPRFDEAQQGVARLQSQVRALMTRIKLLLPANFEALNTKALAECGLPPVPAPFVADASLLQFFANKAQTTKVTLSGGTKEYVVEDTGLPAGLKITPPGKDGSDLTVSLDGKINIKPDTYTLRVHDQTPGGKPVDIQIIVSPAEKSTASSTNSPSKKTRAPPKKNDAPAVKTVVAEEAVDTARILGLKNVEIEGKNFTIVTAERSADKSVLVTVCGPLENINPNNLNQKIRKDAKVEATVNVQKSAVCV